MDIFEFLYSERQVFSGVVIWRFKILEHVLCSSSTEVIIGSLSLSAVFGDSKIKILEIGLSRLVTQLSCFF